MQLFQLRRDTSPPGPQQASCDYARLITDNLAYIEKQCRRAVFSTTNPGAPAGDGLDLENEADELLNQVLDRLKTDDFQALRDFRGKAKITTYITTIISNLIVDLVRQKRGRSRARERAREMGGVAERLYHLVYTQGCSLHEAHSHLEISHGITEPLQSLQRMLERMQGRDAAQVPAGADGATTWLAPGRKMLVDDEVELVVTDPRRNAEAALIADRKQQDARSAVAGLIAELSGEDRFMLSMRFPADEEDEPKSNKEIGALLGFSEKSVDARIRRILVRFREILLRQGLALEDFIDA